MHRSCAFVSRLAQSLTVAVLIAYGIGPVSIARAGHAAAPTASVFYPASAAAYDAWKSTTSTARPAKTIAFPQNTTTIAFYYEYDGASPKVTTFQVAVYDTSGKIYAHDEKFAAVYANGMSMRKLVPDRAGSYAGGTYSAVLWINGHTALRTSFRVASASGAQPTSTPTPGPEAPWLAEINRYRTAAGLAPVIDQPKWDLGLQHHLRYLAKTPARYRTGDYKTPHSENPSSPYYTRDGESEAESNLASDYMHYTDVQLIDVWLTSPFHADPMLDPRLREVAFAYDPTTGYAGLDVISGYDYAMNRTTVPVLFPAPGMTTNLTHEIGTETPDPLVTCHWTGKKVGLPLIARLPQHPSHALKAEFTGPSGFRESTANGSLCIVDGSTYLVSDGYSQASMRQYLKNESLVILIPETPLVPGTFHMRIIQPGQADVQWSFHVGAS